MNVILIFWFYNKVEILLKNSFLFYIKNINFLMADQQPQVPKP